MYHGRPILTWGLKQKQKFLKEYEINTVFREKNKKKQKNEFFIKKTKASCQRTVKGEVVKTLGSLRKMHEHKIQVNLWITNAFLTRELGNRYTCWHMQVRALQSQNIYIMGVHSARHQHT